MKRKNAQTKTADAVTLMAVEREREPQTETLVFNCHDFIYNNIMNKQIEQKNVPNGAF